MTWNWNITDDPKKAERARKTKIDSVDQSSQSGRFIGSSGEVYSTTLENCSCVDFSKNRICCKHMVRLGMELGLLNSMGLTEDQQRSFDLIENKKTLASAYGFYHLFGESLLSDSEYDSLKRKLSSEITSNKP